jgi:hypothetical protein
MKNAPLVNHAIARLRKAYILDYPCDETRSRVHELRAALGDQADLFFRIFARMMNRKRAATALPAALKMLHAHQVEQVKSGPGTAFAGAAHA